MHVWDRTSEIGSGMGLGYAVLVSMSISTHTLIDVNGLFGIASFGSGYAWLFEIYLITSNHSFNPKFILVI